jgi:hypothetical protein
LSADAGLLRRYGGAAGRDWASQGGLCETSSSSSALITPARGLEETGKIAFAKVAEDESDLLELSREQIRALNIKQAALADVGKYLGMSKEKVEHSRPNGGPLQVQAQVRDGVTQDWIANRPRRVEPGV